MTHEEKGKKAGKWLLVCLFAACVLYGGLELLGGVIALILYLGSGATAGEAVSVGIIGGADGPTAIFVTTPGWMHYINPVLLLVIGIGGFLWLRKRK